MNSAECLRKYGEPVNGGNYLVLWDVPTELEIGFIPKRIYCNKDMVKPLEKVFRELIKTGLVKEIKTWDGCFNIRKKRVNDTWSLHSWAVAVDINASENQMGTKGNFTKRFVDVWKENGFVWGGDWGYSDPMHFELK